MNQPAAKLPSFQERLDEIVPVYQKGLEGDRDAVQEANKRLERLRNDYPDTPLAEAFHGSTMILMARDSDKALEKLKLCSNGMKLLDKAVTAAPKDETVRVFRGKAAYQLPDQYFNRAPTAVEDFEFLIEREAHKIGLMTTEAYTQMIYELGEALRRSGRNLDAVTVWEKLLADTDDPQFQMLLQHKIKSLEGRPPVEIIEFTSPTTIAAEKAAGAAGNLLLNWAKRKEKEIEKRNQRKKRRKRRK